MEDDSTGQFDDGSGDSSSFSLSDFTNNLGTLGTAAGSVLAALKGTSTTKSAVAAPISSMMLYIIIGAVVLVGGFLFFRNE